MGPRKSGNKVTSGDTRITDGVTEIWNGAHWLPYPAEADDLIEYARARGWGADDGLPGKGPIRTDQDGMPFVRVLVGRERGWNSDTNEQTDAVQIHMTWVAAVEGWLTPHRGYFKTDRKGWDNVSLEGAYRLITRSPVKSPSVYAEVDH